MALTPKAGRPGYVAPGEVQESAEIAGLRGMSLAVVLVSLDRYPPGQPRQVTAITDEVTS